MKEIDIRIEILSYWHAGSGVGRGGDADSLVVRDDLGLPYLPGRTVKGLFREGVRLCEDFKELPEGTTDSLFGLRADPGDDAGSVPGKLFFRDARLDRETRGWLAGEKDKNLKEALFDTISSTKLDEEGQADDKTLRTIEATIPVALDTTVSGPDEDDWPEAIGRAARVIRSLGSHRHRGLGRCRVSIHDTREGQ